MNRSVPFLLLSLGACAPHAPAAAEGHGLPVGWVVADSVWTPSWNPLEDSLLTYTIDNPASSMSIPWVVEPLPFLTNDGSLMGISVRETDHERQVFRFSPTTGLIETWSLPDDIWLFFRDIAISPDGRYIGYVAQDHDSPGEMHAVVREVQTGQEVVRERGSGPCECDVDRNHARWLSRSEFEIATNGLEGWVIIRGDIVSGVLEKRSVVSEPKWH